MIISSHINFVKYDYQINKLQRSKISNNNTATRIWDRKFSVPISMPQSLLEDIDMARGDIARSLFVCKILRSSISAKIIGGPSPDAAADTN